MGLRALLVTSLLTLFACDEPAYRGFDRVLVRVGLVGLDAQNSPVVVLEEDDGPRLLRIWIGMNEARSIAEKIDERRSVRPNTHDLAERVIHGLEGEVVEVVVSDLRHGIYYATMALRIRGKLVEIDARPSDAIAIALRMNAPIFVRTTLFEEDDDIPDDGKGQEIDWPAHGGPDEQTGSPPATRSVSL